MNEATPQCPRCDSILGFYTKVTENHHYLFFFDGEGDGEAEVISGTGGKAYYCRTCDKNITNFVKGLEILWI